ncbi:Aste57867_21126 [Aphanomyces stellatus]|uniref:Aste57867_21126 protein n=1 Tax=Aphanomyces stellatus TaxID=120398 RepID=A0A485LLE1_9STRA|nr:hypothetical protein As57867_021058 [Aphanomyces stellatus]VFT97800.1 Aste57867_21126 [Aphanomyces stellatus]
MEAQDRASVREAPLTRPSPRTCIALDDVAISIDNLQQPTRRSSLKQTKSSFIQPPASCKTSSLRDADEPSHVKMHCEKTKRPAPNSDVEYDFAIVFKPSRSEDEFAQDSAAVRENVVPTVAANPKVFYRKNPAQAKAELLRRLHRAGLQTKKVRSLDGKQVLIQVKAPPVVLEVCAQIFVFVPKIEFEPKFGAEKMKLKKQRRGDLMWVEFARAMRDTFVDFDPLGASMRFLDKEKQCIVHHLITADDGAGLHDASDLSCVVERMFPLHKANLDHLRHVWLCYWRPPVSDLSAQKLCCPTLRKVARAVRYSLDQPLDDVAEYFGDKVAFYFAWVELYTRWLVPPTLVGILLFLQQIRSQSLDQPLAPFYALFMAVWASLFLVAWKRRASSLAYRWGVLGYEDDDHDQAIRPGYVPDATLGGWSSSWRRWPKYIATLGVTVVCTGATLAVMYEAFTTRDRLQADSLASSSSWSNVSAHLTDDLTLANLGRLEGLLSPAFWFYLLIMPMLYGLCIPLLDLAFTALATRLTEWEHHKTDAAHHSALILKVFPFRCVHTFATLYYYAFTGGNNLLRVAIQLATFMLSGQMFNNVVKTGLPLLRRRYLERLKRLATAKQLKESPLFGHKTTAATTAVMQDQCARLEQASATIWDECELAPHEAFEDYTEMLIQFGYVSFFSLAFPLAPLLALVNNVVALRVDAFKLCHTTQRPLARHASGIGIWFPVLQLMSIVAVITNCLHVAFTTTQIERCWPQIPPATKVWVVFVAEHAVVALQLWIAYVVPSMAKDIKTKVRAEKEFAKQASARAVAASLSSLVDATVADDDDDASNNAL